MSDGAPNVEVFRLAKLIGNFFLWLFGSATLLWLAFGVLVPLVWSFVGSIDTYNNYVYRLMLNEAEKADVYVWAAPGDQRSETERVSRGIIEPIINMTKSTDDPRASRSGNATERAVNAVYAKLDEFNTRIENDWKFLQIDIMTIALLRLNILLPIFLAAIPVWTGFFFAGEYTARRRFEDSFQPSSNRTKYWFQYVRFMPAAAIALPVVCAPFPVVPVFLFAVGFTSYAIYKMRSESMEFV